MGVLLMVPHDFSLFNPHGSAHFRPHSSGCVHKNHCSYAAFNQSDILAI